MHAMKLTDQTIKTHCLIDEPDPFGFPGTGDKVDPRSGCRAGTRTNPESISGFLQAVFVVVRPRCMAGQVTAAFGFYMEERNVKQGSLGMETSIATQSD